MTGRTYLDCYGSLADTAVAEDGNFEEHSWWGSLFSRFGIKQKSRFGLSGGDEKTHHLGDSSGSLRRKNNERVEFRCSRQKQQESNEASNGFMGGLCCRRTVRASPGLHFPSTFQRVPSPCRQTTTLYNSREKRCKLDTDIYCPLR